VRVPPQAGTGIAEVTVSLFKRPDVVPGTIKFHVNTD